MALPLVQCNNSVKYSNSWTLWKNTARTMSNTTMCISRSWTFLGSSVTILWNTIPIHAFCENLQCLNNYEHSDLDLWLITLDQGHDTSCEILFKFIKRVRSYGQDKLFAYVLTVMCRVTLTFDFGSRSSHFLGSSVTILWNIIPIHAFSENLWPGQCLNHYENSDLDLWLITLNQDHDTS
jgi:hypothetical protein